MSEWIDREVEVLVVGAGPSGLSLACELRRRGVPCLLIDEGDGPSPERESRALAIHAGTMEVFHRLGVADRMRAEGRAVHGISVYRGTKRIVDLRLTLSPDETRFPYILILPQARTERILLERLEELGGEVEWRTRLSSFKADLDGATAVLKDGANRETHVRAKWLIGCDGARSAVRHGLGLSFEGGEYPERFLLADVAVDWGMSADEVAVVLTNEGPMVAVPLPQDGRWRLIDGTGKADVDAPEAIVARLRELAGPISGLGGKVGGASWTSPFVIHRRVVDRYRAGRCFVVGDAAHLHSPAGGQGMNTGVQDAANLAWKLAMTIRGQGPESLLESYDAERRPVGEGVLKGTDWVMRLIAARNPLTRALRDATVASLGRLEAVRRRLSRELSELAVSYRRSPIVAEDRPGRLVATVEEGATGYNASRAFLQGPQAGDRLPDVLLAQSDPVTGLPLRLSDLVFRNTDAESQPGAGTDDAGRHVLLVFQGTKPESGAFRVDFLVEEFIPPHLANRLRAILIEPKSPIEASPAWRGERLADPANALHRRFGAEGACLYLVRPDAYIGFRARPLDPMAFRDYVKRIFL
ncbi:FAD-dependent monooxygenase [Planctomyces sp. SH-PL62]|uniref:FAD-dependent monooxygenase n=1 Tax=Planctomyces sp. SH-PL62 TaxID=1636152 RepID=UPI00078CF099|nr:FAD-dependent monooxygenase [Planctomyces sp. SH-PL62]AMV37332.1 Pentachlorophenol 4-monooxygenase [Planctomyces sp. SH-PL62]